MAQAFTKFHEKNQVIYLGQQSSLSVPVTDACFAQVSLSGTVTGAAAATYVLTFGTTNTVTATCTLTGTNLPVITAANIVQALANFTATGATNSIAGVVISAANLGASKYAFSVLPTSVATLGIRDITGAAIPTAQASLVVATGTGVSLSNYVANCITTLGSLALTSISGSPTRDTAQVTYVAGVLARREYTYQKDVYIEMSVETPVQVIGSNTITNIATALTTTYAIGTNVALGTFGVFEACGGYVTIYGSAIGTLFPTGYIQIDNTQQSTSYLTVDYHVSSVDDTTYDKLWKYYDMQGSFDINASIGDMPMLKFDLKGNVSNPITTKVPALIPTPGNQYLGIAPPILPATLVASQLVPLADTYGAATLFASVTYTLPADTSGSSGATATLTATIAAGHGIAVGDIRMVAVGVAGSGAVAETGVNASIYNGTFMALAISTTAVIIELPSIPSAIPTTASLAIGATAAIPFNFGKLSAPDFLGFNYTRYLTGQLTGFTKSGTPTDVTISVLQDQAGTTNWDADASITKFYAAQIKWGTGNNFYTTLLWNALQVSQVKEDKIGDFLAREVTLRNTGNSFLIFS